MKKINVLVNETILTEFVLDLTSLESHISRELFERIHFSKKNDDLGENIPSIPIVTLNLSIQKKQVPAYMVACTEYGHTNIIGKDNLKLFIELNKMGTEETPVINDNLTDAMARISFYYKRHHQQPSYDENVFFSDFDRIVTCAEYFLNNGNYEKVESLLTVFEQFVERKLLRDVLNPDRMGAFLSARFYRTFGLALYHQNRWEEAYKYLLSAVTIYTLESPIGYETYKLISEYPY